MTEQQQVDTLTSETPPWLPCFGSFGHGGPRMHWTPPDEDSDIEVPPWSWLVACPRTETPQ